MDFIKHFSIPTAICDEGLEVVELNQSFGMLFGVEISDSLCDHFASIEIVKLKRKLARGQKYSAIIQTKNDRSIPYELIFDRLDDRIAIIGMDASKVKKAEDMLASYSTMIEQQNRKIAEDNERLELLINNTLPANVVTELGANGQVSPKKFKDVGIMFLDFVNFTEISANNDEHLIFSELNEMFTCFDILAQKYECERIKTIGDAYLAVTNVNVPNQAPVNSLCDFAIDILAILEARNSKLEWNCRIGLHVGDLVAGVVGKTKILFDVFGDGINIASRIEAASQPMKINCSKAFFDRCDFSEHFEARGLIEVKGKAPMEMFFLNKTFKPLDPAAINQIIDEARNTRSIITNI